MKITKKLLERHGLGLCSEDEKKAIERWFETLDDPSLNLRTDNTPEFKKEYTWSKMAQTLPELEDRMSLGRAKQIQLFKYALRYAAAACFVVGVFFIGRISVGTANANSMPKNPMENMLHIAGVNGAEGYLPGQEFEIRFDGQIKLFNGAPSRKKIYVGEKSFFIESYRTYYLSGSTENPFLHDSDMYIDDFSDNELEGVFSIIRTDI